MYIAESWRVSRNPWPGARFLYYCLCYFLVRGVHVLRRGACIFTYFLVYIIMNHSLSLTSDPVCWASSPCALTKASEVLLWRTLARCPLILVLKSCPVSVLLYLFRGGGKSCRSCLLDSFFFRTKPPYLCTRRICVLNSVDQASFSCCFVVIFWILERWKRRRALERVVKLRGSEESPRRTFASRRIRVIYSTSSSTNSGLKFLNTFTSLSGTTPVRWDGEKTHENSSYLSLYCLSFIALTDKLCFLFLPSRKRFFMQRTYLADLYDSESGDKR